MKINSLSPNPLDSLNRKVRLALVGIFLVVFHFLSAMNEGFTTGPTLCVFNILTGYPCPTCGTTRAIAAISEGRMIDSINFNPLGILILLIAIFWSLKVLPNQRMKMLIYEKFGRISTRGKTLSLVLILSLGWAWTLSRW
jgi:hypothetical protein